MFFYLFYPPKCRVCSQWTTSYKEILCLSCENEFNILDINVDSLSRISEKFFGTHHLVCAQSISVYTKDSVVQKLIHALKYEGRQEVGVYFANAYAHKIKKLHQKHHFDIILPVPLHIRKKSERGYNQLTYFGKELSKILSVPYHEGILIRTHYDTSQTKFGYFQRVNKVANPFAVKKADFLRNKHILLIDDVITTGATLRNCLDALSPLGAHCSILAMAFTE